MKYVAATLILLTLSACSALLPANQARVAEIEATEAATRSQIEALAAQIAALQAEPNHDPELVAALEAQRGVLEGLLAELKAAKATVVAEDAGQQTGAWMDLATLLLLGVTGGGGAAAALQKFGRSRSAAEVAHVTEELARIKGLLEAYQKGLAIPPKPA